MEKGRMRTERDDLGEIRLPEEALYGCQTARAMENFPLGKKVNPLLIGAVVEVKKAAAAVYRKLCPEEAEKWDAILWACDQLLAGGYEEQFSTAALQGGAGTSTNMNVNEVIAGLARRKLGPDSSPVHPLDDVNRGQSTNDVYPTALRIAAIRLIRTLSDSCAGLQEASA